MATRKLITWTPGESGVTLFADGSPIHVSALGLLRAWALMIVAGIAVGRFGSPPSFVEAFLAVSGARILYRLAYWWHDRNNSAETS